MKLKKMLMALSAVAVMTALLCSAARRETKKMSQDPSVKETVAVTMKTNQGDILLELYPEKAPKTVENFLRYVRDGHYDGTIFHRVIDGFMIQGGGFSAEMKQKPTRDPIENEAANGLLNTRGTIAMARTMDVNSATAQFFINCVDNDFLNHRDTSSSGFGYCVFGRVLEGLDVVDVVAKVKTGAKGHFRDVPLETVSILTVTVTEKGS